MNPSALTGVDLHDIHAAPAPEFWPPAPGWWVLAALILGVLIVISWRLISAWRRHQRQVRILSELDSLSTRSPEQVATQVSTLLRRVALMCYSRQEVASLNGDDWLTFLDRTGGNGAFINGSGKVLATAPYASAHKLSGNDNDVLISLARQWIKQNLGRCA